MAANSALLTSRNWQTRKRSRSFLPCFLAALLLIVILSAISLLQTSNTGTGADETTDGAAKISNKILRNKDLLPSLKLPNEALFIATMKECAHGEKCKQAIPPENGNHRKRIGVLSLPGKGPDLFFEILSKALLEYYDHQKEKMDADIELIQTHHVPPYGYGKSHGWTTIVRVINGPLIQEAIEATMAVVESTGNKILNVESIVHDDDEDKLLSRGMQQAIRWHCRLSHVAAHTALYNVNLNIDTSNNGKMQYFAHKIAELTFAIATEANSTPHAGFRYGDKLRKIESMINEEMKSWTFTSSPFSETAAELMEIMSQEELDGHKMVLATELQSTNNLKKWPCPSLWDLQGLEVTGENDKVEEKKELSKSLTKMLVPDCSAPFVTCTVKKDRCEESGDLC